MSKRSKAKTPVVYSLPVNALQRVNLGQAFAEYDKVLSGKKGIFVRTPAIDAALDPSRSKCFFVGRRGTGKTAITFYVKDTCPSAIMLQPQTFSATGLPLNPSELRNSSQKNFRSLVSCFKRALLDEVLCEWITNDTVKFNDERSFSIERPFIEDSDFDLRMISFVEKTFSELHKPQERDWLRELKKVKTLAQDMDRVGIERNRETVILIDRIDEAWDGSDTAVLFLMALMHACLELASHHNFIRPMLFLRENIFERVKQIDSEYARLETCVVSLNWTKELLVELVERRLQANLNPKPPIGETWDYFFEKIDGSSSREMVFDYCQLRPRDILTYCAQAIESAISATHKSVKIEDLHAARKRFSESRLKDLGDEYSENYPQIQLILQRFHGLGTEFTVGGIESLIQKLLIDSNIREVCGSWFFDFTTPSRLIQLLYSIGFWGIKTRDQSAQYRSVGTKASSTPAIEQSTIVVVHPSYHHGLDLPPRLITDLDTDLNLQDEGLVLDIPDSIRLNDYVAEVSSLIASLGNIPNGHPGENEFETLVGRMIELCFFRSLTNVAPQVRDDEGRVIRDWIASNRAQDGFWELIRSRHGSTQVIWECKNFEELTPSTFHQMGYYLNDTIGRFGLVCFRGDEIKPHYYSHLKRLADKENKFLLLLTARDLMVFLRQAKNGKVKDSHIAEIYDRTIRKIS